MSNLASALPASLVRPTAAIQAPVKGASSDRIKAISHEFEASLI